MAVTQHIFSGSGAPGAAPTAVGHHYVDILNLKNYISVGTGSSADWILNNDPTALNTHISNISNPHSVTKTQVGLSNVDDTSDINKPVSTATQTALDLKADLSSPTFTGIPIAPTASNGTNTTQIATTAFVLANGGLPTDATTSIKGIVKLAGDLSGTADLPTVPGLAGKEPIITATTSADYYRGDKTFQLLDKVAVGLSNVLDIDTTITSNIVDSLNKRFITDAQQIILGNTSGTNTGDNATNTQYSGLSSSKEDIANKAVDLTSPDNIKYPTTQATQTALNLKADLASPSFTGTVSGITAAMVGLPNVDNTSDANKPVSTAQQTALNLKANLASPTFTGTVSGITASMIGAPSGSGTSSGTNTGDQTSVSGNAGTATILATTRTIDGVNFNGSANITVIAPATNAATSKATPVDADELPITDSNASFVLKKLTWANLKATFLNTVNKFLVAQRVTITNVSSSAGILTLDLNASNDFSIQLSENTTLGIPSNLDTSEGLSGMMLVRQNATAAKTLAFNAFFRFTNGAIPLVTTSLNGYDRMPFHIDKVLQSTVTISIAAPAVITLSNHGLVFNDRVYFTTTGALPTGLANNTTYFISSAIDANTFSVSATAGGASITTTGTQSGVHTLTHAVITCGWMGAIN